MLVNFMILEKAGRDFEINVTHLILQIDVLDFFIGSIACTYYTVADRLREWWCLDFIL